MDHLTIDLGGRQSRTCVRSGEGQITQEGRVRKSELRSFLEKSPKSLVIVETCSESSSVADDVLAADLRAGDNGLGGEIAKARRRLKCKPSYVMKGEAS